jgi:hypothetical protein
MQTAAGEWVGDGVFRAAKASKLFPAGSKFYTISGAHAEFGTSKTKLFKERDQDNPALGRAIVKLDAPPPSKLSRYATVRVHLGTDLKTMAEADRQAKSRPTTGPVRRADGAVLLPTSILCERRKVSRRFIENWCETPSVLRPGEMAIRSDVVPNVWKIGKKKTIKVAADNDLLDVLAGKESAGNRPVRSPSKTTDNARACREWLARQFNDGPKQAAALKHAAIDAGFSFNNFRAVLREARERDEVKLRYDPAGVRWYCRRGQRPAGDRRDHPNKAAILALLGSRGPQKARDIQKYVRLSYMGTMGHLKALRSSGRVALERLPGINNFQWRSLVSSNGHPASEVPAATADDGVYVSATEAAAQTALLLPAISRLCRQGKVRSRRPRGQRLEVHLGDLSRYMAARDRKTRAIPT